MTFSPSLQYKPSESRTMTPSSLTSIHSIETHTSNSSSSRLGKTERVRYKGSPKTPLDSKQLAMGFSVGDFSIMLDVATMVSHQNEITSFVVASQKHYNAIEAVWPSTERFARIMRDIIPIYNKRLPSATGFAYRTLAAIMELTPRRLNTVTVIPALLELMTVATSLSNTMEDSFPVTSLVLEEMEVFLANFVKYLPHLDIYLTEVNTFLPIVGKMDPMYNATMQSTITVFTTIQDVIPELMEFLSVYNRASPNLRRFLHLLAGMSADVTQSLDVTLGRLSEDGGSSFLDMYEEPEDFVPLFASNVISILRRSGLPARLPSLRLYVPETHELINATVRLLESTSGRMRTLQEALIPLAASIPRTPGILELSSDTLVQLSVVLSQFDATLIPIAMSFLKSATPFLIGLDAPVINILALLPMAASLVSGGVLAIPRISAAMPAIAPLLTQIQTLLDLTFPMIDPLRTIIDAASSLPSNARDTMTTAVWQCISYLPSLFSQGSSLPPTTT
eukprot:Blabericola_migrator_1__5764@NODE_2920_length_2208_cov_66_429706_g84_i1_p1_GENE_NODE_2920_length_2208_cov_66_429706_g84_i1NODE_2920_length_2208_cov_66_429706_g84_i1_p1_ORF_typecomplete_len507_score61_57Mce4_CUP1/PF11887_8/1_1e02Mce4_CUP1/PF11887_8/0_88Mce4_CUP1/PF11887_8/43Mce4_CUP1/PF11887_8/4_1e03_NODE_2920_length_2208_cov_66_429706_g84_i1631583